LASKAIKFGEKCKLRAIMPFKVIQGHQSRYQSNHFAQKTRLNDLSYGIKSG